MKVIIQKKFNFAGISGIPIFVPYKDECVILKKFFGENFFEGLKALRSDSSKNFKTTSLKLVLVRDGNVFTPIIYFKLPETFDNNTALKVGKKVVEILFEHNYDGFYYLPIEDILGLDHTDYTFNFITGLFYGLYNFNKYKKDERERKISELHVVTENNNLINFFNNSLEELRYIFKYLNTARDLTNEPSNIINPESFCNYVKSNVNEKISLEVWDDLKIEKEKLNLISAVGKGSPQKPRFLIMNYKGDLDRSDNICLVGKGVTFDSGGTNLKPTGSIETMKSDMAGAAISYALINLVAAMQLKINLVVLLPLVENIIGTNSYKPGDIYTSYSGKRVEILNTDAEGRLILADSISYGVKNGARLVIDVATLTGAIVVTFGAFCGGYFTNNEFLSQAFLESVKKTGEPFFRLPLYEEYKDRIKSKNADLQNVANQRREAGAIIAALFLEEFVDNKPWIHLDIAGPAFIEEEHPIYGHGGTAFGFRSLYEFIKMIYGSDFKS